MADKLTPVRALRLMRAKASELEQLVLADAEYGLNQHRAVDRVMQLTADVALLFSLLADFQERIDEEYVPIGDPLFNEDGTPWHENWQPADD